MIDEKKLIKRLESMQEKCNTLQERLFFDGILAIVDTQPKVGEWIPCSERLPVQEKLLQTYLITFEYYRYGEYNCMHKNVGTGTFDKNTQEFIFVNQQTGWKDLNVLAWQPLPKPYEEKENE